MKVKILITVSAWQRRKITTLCYLGIKRLQAYNPDKFDISVLVIESNEEDKKLAKKFGFNTIYAENKPFGRKLNIGLSESLALDFDYKLGLGSDDLISNKLLDIYYEYFLNNVDIIGVNDLALVDSATLDAKKFNYGQMIGAGRAIKKSLLEKAAIRYKAVAKKSFFDTRVNINFRKGEEVLIPMSFKNEHLQRVDKDQYISLWDNNLECGADSNSQKALKAFNPNIVQVGAKKPLIVDIKSDVNITGYADLKGPPMDLKDLFLDFPELKFIRKKYYNN